LESSYRVYSAFYSDVPGYAEQVCNAIEDGASRIVVVHVRVTEPPDAVRLGDVLEGLNPESYGVQMEQAGPLSDSVLLPQIYVRRVLEALPHVDAHSDDTGLLLVGRGNAEKKGRFMRRPDRGQMATAGAAQRGNEGSRIGADQTDETRGASKPISPAQGISRERKRRQPRRRVLRGSSL
jgi:hypothetical protein